MTCKGIVGIVKDKSARVVLELENNCKVFYHYSINLVQDVSEGLIDTKLFLESAFRSAPMTKRKSLTSYKAAIDDLNLLRCRVPHS